MNVGSKNTIFLIDGYALLYRSYFAFLKNPLTTSKGENVSAIYGFLNSILKIVRDHHPDYLCLVYDTKEPTFRHEIYPEYKATREKMPEDLAEQIPKTREIAEAMGIPIVELVGYEADDVIGTLAVRALSKGLDAVIVSGDKDFYQLVQEGLMLYDPRKAGKDDEWVGTKNAHLKFGVPAEMVRDVLALMGDSSDNVPGVPGIGKKTAVKLIREHGSLDGIYDNLEKISSKSLHDKLSDNRESAFLSRDLVTIDVDLQLELDMEHLRTKAPDEARLLRIFDELEFHSLKRRFFGSVEATGEAIEVNYVLIDDMSGFQELITKISRGGLISLDLETTDLDPVKAEIVGISISMEEGKGYYIPLMHEEGANLPVDEVLSSLKPLLESAVLKKVGQNLKYDASVLAGYGINLSGIHFDTMIAAYLLDPTRRSYSLDQLVSGFLRHKMRSYDEVTGVGKKRIPFTRVPVLVAKDYSCEDADYTLRLFRLLEPELREKDLFDLLQRVELPLITVLVGMERTGVSIDAPFFAELSRKMGSMMRGIEGEIYEIAGEVFNINSTKQLSEILFRKLKIPVVKRTKTGYSTDSEVLETLSREYEIARKLLDYRELSKLRSTYVDALPKQINPRTGRVHTSFNQVMTATGRLSSSEPNLQNIPVRTELGREIRKGFIPSAPERVLLTADYSQIELRIVAHVSRDENMISAFNFGADIHRQTAALVFGVSQEEVTPELRSRAKEINFGVIYGMGPFGLSRRLDIPMEEARGFIDSYFQRYSGVKAYIDKTVEEAKERGYVTTLLGRRRYLPGIHSRNRNVREFAIRTAINSPIQGTAADLIKIAMIDIHRELESLGLDAKMIIQVHDELVFDVDKSAVEDLRRIVRHKMERALELIVPVTVDIGVGDSWYSCKT
ncbi:MAG: DNA polymerase I [Candidatus Glassbacteria bacterium]